MAAKWGTFQSTHPRRVRRSFYKQVHCTPSVSIHAPTQGATLLTLAVRLSPLFQSTHPRRVRLLLFAVFSHGKGFQSTHPRRVRPRRVHYLCGWPMFQSTHPRRVRQAVDWLKPDEISFNPRTHAGCDSVNDICSICQRPFQSTHPRRVRPTLSTILTRQ